MGEDASAALAQPDPEAMEAFTNLVSLCKEWNLSLIHIYSPIRRWISRIFFTLCSFAVSTVMFTILCVINSSCIT